MLTDLNARSSRRNGRKFAANLGGSIRLGVKTIVLRQATRQKNENDRLGGGGGNATRDEFCSAKRRNMIHPQTEQTDGTGLQRGSSTDLRMGEVK